MVGMAMSFSALSVPTFEQDQKAAITPIEARKGIEKFYADWGKARVKQDLKAFDSMLSSDFKAIIFGQTMDKEGFVKIISAPSPMTRFEATVLTVQPQNDLWIAVITEKLEGERKDSAGKTLKSYSYWVTRDSFRFTEGRWVAVSTEAIGAESWRNEKPPIKFWDQAG